MRERVVLDIILRISETFVSWGHLACAQSLLSLKRLPLFYAFFTAFHLLKDGQQWTCLAVTAVIFFFSLVYFGIMPPNSYTNFFWWVIATRNFWYSSLMFWVWGNQIKGVACCTHFSLLNNYRLLFCRFFIALFYKISLWGFCQQGKDMEPHVMSWKKNCSGSMKRLFHRIVDVLLQWFRQCS